MNPLKFVGVAKAVAALSKDTTKVGAVCVDDDGTLLSVGYNGFPRGVSDDPARYADRTVKLQLVSHAEQNLIAQAARTGARLLGSSIVLSHLHPCANCAKSIIQAGIKRVYAPTMDPTETNPQWFRERELAQLLFAEAGVLVIEYPAGEWGAVIG